MAENQILPFAQGQGANVLSQADYAGDSMRLQGHQPGVARSALENKALLQCSSIAAGLAQFIADGQADDVTDAKTPAEIAAMFASSAAAQMRDVFSIEQLNAGPGYIKLPAEEGKPQLIIQWGGATITAQGQSVAYPIAFPTAVVSVNASVNANSTYSNAVISVRPVDVTRIAFGTADAGSSLNVNWIAIGY